MDREYFSFELSTGIDLALPLTDMKVATQFEVTNICVVPGVADFWYGVTNFKGSLMWVLDSDRFLNGADAPASRRDFEATASESLRTRSVPVVEDDDLSRRLCGETPKTAQHRFFNTVRSDRQPKKLTTVILHQQQAQKKVAIATRQLKGIISIWPDSFKPIENDTSILSKCCNAVVQTEALSTYIIESAALLQQLQKRSLTNAALKDS